MTKLKSPVQATETSEDRRAYKTHEVLNQVAPLANYNLFATNKVLVDSVERAGAGWAGPRLNAFGELMGRAETIELGFLANANPPILHTHDVRGNRIDKVEFHPSFHELMRIAVENELHSLPWKPATEKQSHRHLVRAAQFMLNVQNEPGHCCPISMTYAVVPALSAAPELEAKWKPLITSNIYDPRFIPWYEKKGLILGMAMTEKQGGSDVRANTTTARPQGARGTGKPYLITGHKWFCSHPMADAFLVLAQTEKGISCFLVPRFLEDGSQNRIYIQRLKNKLGNKSNASSEVEYLDTTGYLVGEEGRGVPTIIEMVNHTRLDCMISAGGLMRQAQSIAINHVKHRQAFGKLLTDQPLMQNVVSDLCLETEAATLLTMRVAQAYDRQDENPKESAFRRIATAIGKYFTTKRTPPMVAEALECLGGGGYVEECGMPRLLKESPLNSIWEGSGNVICLDVLRAMFKEPESLEAYFEELQQSKGMDSRLDIYIDGLRRNLAELMKTPAALEGQARLIVERLALALAASLFLRYSEPFMAEAYIATRISGAHGYCFGTLPTGCHFEKIIARAL
ncbi:MAG: acyl-CoA dehydrogenase family protein [Cyanobacteria bacterium SZAS LIN-3]|nr:acyl-CoA dehydrogenase family protein [Cyanobacteria bacterium SZAS LIN-3]